MRFPFAAFSAPDNLPALSHQNIGLFWALVRDAYNIDFVKRFGRVPDDYYAYNNIDEIVDFSNSDAVRIGNHAFFKSNLNHIKLPKTIEVIGDRAFCGIDISPSYELLIEYPGTKKEWRAIQKAPTAFYDPYNRAYPRRVICSLFAAVTRASTNVSSKRAWMRNSR